MSEEIKQAAVQQVIQPPNQVAIDLAAERVSEAFRALRDHYDAVFSERDIRYRERFEASQLAVQAAFVAQEKAVITALTAAEKLNSAALTSAERAVLKAEAAAERRFESVNEFRQTLSDQAASLITRNEVTARFEAVGAKIDAGLDSASKEINVTASRLDRIEGKSGGVNAAGGALVAGVGLLISIISVVVLLVRP